MWSELPHTGTASGVRMITDNQRMARSAGLLFGVGGMFAAVALFLPHPAGSNEAGIAGVSAIALATAGALMCSFAARLPVWAFSALMFVGTALVSIAMYFWRPGPVASSVAMIYVWVLLYAYYWFDWRTAIAHTAMVGASFALVLAVQRADQAAVTQWIVTVGTATVSGVLIGWLVHRVQTLADTDPLTGIPNRRAWEAVLDRELLRSRRTHSPLCVAIADLDGFKEVNDHGGHHAGDDLLTRIASAWKPMVRRCDFLARYGGDEFAMVMACGREEAADAVQRMLSAFHAQPCTVGIACWDGAESRAELVGRADLDLYRGKWSKAGRPQSSRPTRVER
jgi:diguanylate cyclase (GGDEF)-like protein